MRYRVLPYRQGSAGAKALAAALGGKVLKLQGSTFKPKPADTVINWGNTDPPNTTSDESFMVATMLNHCAAIRKASNKREFFQLMAAAGLEDIIPRFWTSKEDIPDDAFPIVCRTVLAGHSGDGIVISPSRDSIVPAPLYVEYIKKQEEYRVHVGKRGGECVVIGIQRKARRIECPNPNWQVRNHANGFVFQRNGVSPPASVCEVAKKALAATLLDFGAVDVLWNELKGKAYVLEINTAPGLEGQTVEDYAAFFRGVGS